MKTDDDYLSFWGSLDSEGKIKYGDFVDKKWAEYSLKGFVIHSFRSGTFIEHEGIIIYSSRQPIIHFLKSIDFLDEFKI